MITKTHGYRVMPRPRLELGDIALRAVEPRDIESIRKWRNAQMDVLRQSRPISSADQEQYFAEKVWPDLQAAEPRQILLAIERNGALIGYGGLVHISWDYRRAEISFLLEPTLERDRLELAPVFSEFLRLMQELAFKDLGLLRLTTETYAHRKEHITILEKAGHKLEGILRDHTLVQGCPSNALLHGILAREWSKRCLWEQPKKILVTSSSRKASLIQALKAAASKCNSNLDVIAGDSDAAALTKYIADEFWEMPRLEGVNIYYLIDECISRQISVVLPTRDGELDFWAQNRHIFLESGIEVIISPAVAVGLCRDKLAFSKFGVSAGLPVIPAMTSLDFFENSLLVVKERFGSASRGLGLALTHDQALEHAKTLESPIFQPFVPGPEISIDSWVSKRGKVPGVVLRRREVVVSGESQVTTTFHDQALEEQAIRFIQALELRGPVVLQAIVVDDKIHVIECNPRFGGASTAAIAVGLDSLYWSLAEIQDDGFEPTFNRMPGEARQVRVPVDRVMYGSDF